MKRRRKISGIQSISATDKKPYLTAGNTGYAALTGVGLTGLTAMVKSKKVNKFHKPAAYTTIGFVLLHTFTVLHNRHQWKKMNQNKDQ